MMGENHARIIASKLENELASLDKIHSSFTSFRESVGDEPANELELRLFGSFLHDFYTCIERVFREIAVGVDGEEPTGQSWHKRLLDQMLLNIPGVRPSIISASLVPRLNDYLRFRHVFRNVYGFDLQWDKLSSLVKDHDEIYSDITSSIRSFIQFLLSVQTAPP